MAASFRPPSSCQIRAARAALGWQALELAKRAGIGLSTLRRLENRVGIPNTTTHTLGAIRRCLEAAGVTFLDHEAGLGEGIRFRPMSAERPSRFAPPAPGGEARGGPPPVGRKPKPEPGGGSDHL